MRLHSRKDLPIDTRDLHEAGWRTSTESCYKAAWKSFKGHLRSSNVSLDRAGVTDVMNYLTLFYKRKLSYSTINIHISAISMTLAKVDGAPLGGHSHHLSDERNLHQAASLYQFGTQSQSRNASCIGPFL
jgi:hypothetical protein